MSARKPAEESVQEPLEESVDPRLDAINALRQGAAEDAVAEQEAINEAAPVIDDRSFRRWDGDTKYEVVGGGFMAIVDGNHSFADTGTVLGLKAETAKVGVNLGLLRKL